MTFNVYKYNEKFVTSQICGFKALANLFGIKSNKCYRNVCDATTVSNTKLESSIFAYCSKLKTKNNFLVFFLHMLYFGMQKAVAIHENQNSC